MTERAAHLVDQVFPDVPIRQLVLSLRDDARDAAAARADTRLQRPLVSTGGRILFHVETVTTYDTYVVNADGTGAGRLTHSPPEPRRFPAPAVVSPDGGRLPIVRDGISLLRIDRPGEIARLKAPAGWLAWSPDGRQLARSTSTLRSGCT